MMKLSLIPVAALIVWAVFIIGANAQSLTPAPKPPEEIAGLTKALEGEWSLSVKFEPSASAPNGLANSGEETWRPGPGGFTLLEEEHLRMPDGDVFLLGIVWWNTANKSLHGMECQNVLPYTCDVKGAQNDITMNWDGKQFVIDEMETSKSGKESVWHEVWSDITANSFTQIGEYGEPGGPRKRLFTIHAKKVANSPIKNDQSQSNNAGPAPEMQSLAKALKGNWSTTYEFAPGGISPTGGTGIGATAHSHDLPNALLAVTNVRLKTTAQDGTSTIDDVKAGDVRWVNSKAVHTLTNAGSSDGQIVEIEMK